MLRRSRKPESTKTDKPSFSNSSEKFPKRKRTPADDITTTGRRFNRYLLRCILIILTVTVATILFIGSSQKRSNLIKSRRQDAVLSSLKSSLALQKNDNTFADFEDESGVKNQQPPLQPGDAHDGNLILTEKKPSPLVKDSPAQVKKKVQPFTAEEDASLLLTDDFTKLHIIFSTDCSSFQHWQSYVLFYSAMRIKQPGYVTRIASGCSDEETGEVQKWHDEHIALMSSRFRVHFTPHFSSVTDKDGNAKGDYKYFNKPFGLRHFLEHDPLMGLDEDGKMKEEDTIIILIDPDMWLLRPIIHDYSNERDVVIGPRKKKDRLKKVEHGVPFAQTYGMGMKWMEFNLDYITSDPNSPAKDVVRADGSLHYPGGPPYIATARDMHAISIKWAEFAPRLHEEYPHLLAEMYAYCVAAAHLRLPHQLVDSLMVSAQETSGEGWPMVNEIPDTEVCDTAINANHEKYPIPSTVHYCQRYWIGTWFWGKRKVPHDIFTCESPIFDSPPSQDVINLKHRFVRDEKKEMTDRAWKHNAFVVCAMLNGVAEAMEFYKEMHCDEENRNTKHTLTLSQY